MEFTTEEKTLLLQALTAVSVPGALVEQVVELKKKLSDSLKEASA